MEPLYKCVWMTAGVLNYRLCDREYDCDHCLVDAALREGKTPPGGGPSEAPTVRATHQPSVSGWAVMPHAFHHPTHIWVRVGEGGSARIGIDEVCRRLLGPIRSIRLPSPGVTFLRDESAIAISCEGGEVELPTPVGGTVLARNEAIALNPEVLGTARGHRAWLVKIRPNRLREDLERLLYGRRAGDWMRAEIDRIRNRLLTVQAAGGGTLPDGGHLAPDVLDRLDIFIRRSLVEEQILAPGRRQKGR